MQQQTRKKRSATISDGEVLDADIRELNLVPVCFLLATSQQWPLARIRRAELEYRLFLQMVRNDPRQIPVPSLDADQFWHGHLQCLELYVDDCQRLFGRLLLHYPFAGAFGGNDTRRQRQRFQKSQAKLAEMRGARRPARTNLRQPRRQS
jgi:hypothetical protein